MLAAVRLRPTEQTEREARRMDGEEEEEEEGREKACIAASRAEADIVPSIRVCDNPAVSKCRAMISRKEVHWLKITVLVVASLRREAWRMDSKAVILLLVPLASSSWSFDNEDDELEEDDDSPPSIAGWTNSAASPSSARHMGHFPCVSITRSMHDWPNECAQMVMTGEWRVSRQIGQSSWDSIESCSMDCNAARVSGVRVTVGEVESCWLRREETREEQRCQWLQTWRRRRRISRRWR